MQYYVHETQLPEISPQHKWTIKTKIKEAIIKKKYTSLIEQVFFSVWQKQDQATKDFLLMDFMSKAQ